MSRTIYARRNVCNCLCSVPNVDYHSDAPCFWGLDGIVVDMRITSREFGWINWNVPGDPPTYFCLILFTLRRYHLQAICYQCVTLPFRLCKCLAKQNPGRSTARSAIVLSAMNLNKSTLDFSSFPSMIWSARTPLRNLVPEY